MEQAAGENKYEIYCTSKRFPAERYATDGVLYATIEDAREAAFLMFKNHMMMPDESADVLIADENERQGFRTVASWTWEDFNLTPVMG